MQIRRTEVNVNKKRPETLFRKQNSETAGYKTLAGAALPSSDGTYMSNMVCQSSNLSNHHKIKIRKSVSPDPEVLHGLHVFPPHPDDFAKFKPSQAIKT